MESMLSEFDYFNPTVLQSSIIKEYDESIAPVNSTGVQGNALSTFEFIIAGATDLYRDLNNSYVELKVKVVDAAGANLAATDAVAPTNLFLHSLFANVSINLCGKEITEKDSLYPYRAYLETLLSYNQNVLETRGVGEGWHKDKHDLMNSVALAVQQGQPDPNPGWIERRKTILQSRTVTLIGRPHLDMFHQNLDLPPGCPMIIRFTPSTSAFAFIGAIAHLAVKVTLVQATLYVRTKQVCPELILAHKEMLQKCNMRFPHNRVTVSKQTIGTGVQSDTLRLNFPAKLPKRIFVGFVLNTASTGTITENPYRFQNFGLENIYASVTGEHVPVDGITTNYTTGDFQRAYINTLAALGLDNDNRAIWLKPEEFASGYNLYGFKLAPGPIDGTVFCSARSAGSLSVYVKFAAPLTAAVDAIIFAETPAVLEIDKLSSVTLV
jgi:hypothetical protein